MNVAQAHVFYGAVFFWSGDRDTIEDDLSFIPGICFARAGSHEPFSYWVGIKESVQSVEDTTIKFKTALICDYGTFHDWNRTLTSFCDANPYLDIEPRTFGWYLSSSLV